MIAIVAAPTSIARGESFEIVATGALALQGGGGVILGGETCTIDSWSDTSIFATADSTIDLLYAVATHALVVTADDATFDTSAAIPFTPATGRSYIALTNQLYGSDLYALFGYTGTPYPVVGDQLEYSSMTSPDGIVTTSDGTSALVLASVPTVDQTITCQIIRAATGVRSAPWTITLITSAFHPNIDISGWVRQLVSPIYDGGNPLSLRGTPTYTPLTKFNFAGVNGAEISSTEFAGNSATTHSNAIAGPRGASTTGRHQIDLGASGYSGTYLEMAGIQTLHNSDIWFSKAYYFPSSFCAGYQAGGDGYGSTKWERLAYTAIGERITLQLAGFTEDACAIPALEFAHLSLEIDGPERIITYPTPGIIPRDKWVILCTHIHLATDGTGYVRGWFSEANGAGWDTIYLGQGLDVSLSDVYQTLPAADNVLDSAGVGGYWNGNAYQATAWYTDELIISMQTPNTLDAGGRPFISPYTAVADYA